jgi:PTH1 family peptidyl-tRNA hydrolase
MDSQLVVGLGNPGPEYRDTRHNMGQAVLDRLAHRLGCRFRLRRTAHVAEARHGADVLHLAKPVSFMNVVGPSVARLLRDLGLDAGALIVVYDDIDLPFGKVRIRLRGRHGGHNGVRSILDTVGTDAVRRVKIGVGRPESRERGDVSDWVLDGFTDEERDALPSVLDRAADAVLEVARMDRVG